MLHELAVPTKRSSVFGLPCVLMPSSCSSVKEGFVGGRGVVLCTVRLGAPGEAEFARFCHGAITRQSFNSGHLSCLVNKRSVPLATHHDKRSWTLPQLWRAIVRYGTLLAWYGDSCGEHTLRGYASARRPISSLSRRIMIIAEARDREAVGCFAAGICEGLNSVDDP